MWHVALVFTRFCTLKGRFTESILRIPFCDDFCLQSSHLSFSVFLLKFIVFFFLLLSKYIHSSTVLIRITMLIYILSILMHCYNNTTNNASIVYNKYHWEKIVIPLTGSLCRRFILLSAKFLKCFEKLIWLMSSVYFDMLFFSGEVMQIISFY